eukprot:scaffold13609_cov72-Phaeocystis_antarctica.AAC.3
MKGNEASVRYVIDLSTLSKANPANIESTRLWSSRAKPPGQLESRSRSCRGERHPRGQLACSDLQDDCGVSAMRDVGGEIV